MDDSSYAAKRNHKAVEAALSGQSNSSSMQVRGKGKTGFKRAEGVAASINAIAIALSQGKTADELALMSAVFVQLSDTLATISTVRSICENERNKHDTQNKTASTD